MGSYKHLAPLERQFPLYRLNAVSKVGHSFSIVRFPAAKIMIPSGLACRAASIARTSFSGGQKPGGRSRRNCTSAAASLSIASGVAPRESSAATEATSAAISRSRCGANLATFFKGA